MSVTIALAPQPAAALPRPKISVARYLEMVATGKLGEDDKVELLNGEIVAKMPIGDPHCYGVDTLNDAFADRLRGRALVRVQNPIQLPESVPEPDVALARLPRVQYQHRKPKPEDLFLVVEVADSSIDRDLEEKASLYAAAGIVEYWVVDLPERCVWVHLGPQPDGTWTSVVAKRPGDELAPQAFPEAAIDLAELLA